jgi:mRNA interferase RelE/StbE
VARYRVLIKPSAAKEIEAVDQKKDRQRIVAGIRSLADDPRPPGCEKLAGEDDRYRIRVGRYRVIYSVGDGELLVVVVRVGHRKDVYR